MEKNNFM